MPQAVVTWMSRSSEALDRSRQLLPATGKKGMEKPSKTSFSAAVALVKFSSHRLFFNPSGYSLALLGIDRCWSNMHL